MNSPSVRHVDLLKQHLGEDGDEPWHFRNVACGVSPARSTFNPWQPLFYYLSPEFYLFHKAVEMELVQSRFSLCVVWLGRVHFVVYTFFVEE